MIDKSAELNNIFYFIIGVKEPVHLIFAVDATGRDEPNVLESSKVFFKDLGNRFTIPEQGITHGFVKYDPSNTAKVDFVKFDEYTTLPAYINTLQSTNGKTTLDHALRDSVPGLLNSLDEDDRRKDPYPKVRFMF